MKITLNQSKIANKILIKKQMTTTLESNQPQKRVNVQVRSTNRQTRKRKNTSDWAMQLCKKRT